MVKGLACETSGFLADSLSSGKEILLEGSQGFLLDIDHGTYPFVTSCNTGVHGLACGAGLAPSAIDEVIGVTKAYMTRVGEGPLPTEMEEPYQSQIRERGKEYGATTGRPRRCGWLDLNAVRYSSRTNGITSLAVTKLDTLTGIGSLKVGVAYEFFGNCIEGFPADVEILAGCVPRYADCATWEMLPRSGSPEDLPQAADEYLTRIADAGRCRVRLVSCGPGRGDLIEFGH
jgi:adenylosuccinate synthase